ncbi:MAG: SpoIIIAH-like family protein [Clostridia bacterium]
MKTILKRNQLVILVIALVLVTAGYLNYTSMNENNENTVMTSQIVAELGDATLVSSTDIENEEVETTQNEEIEQIDEQVLTSATTEDTYYTSSKLERDNMFSQLLETYQEVYNNVNSTAEQRNTAISEMAKINKTKNSVMISENLIKTKGFEDVVIFVNTNSISVIIKAEEISSEQIAQVQNIISRELEVGAEIIHISTK